MSMIPGLEMGDGNSVSTSNAQDTQNTQAFNFAGPVVNSGGSELPEWVLPVAGVTVLGLFFLMKKRGR